jgi:hypothetical protein
MCRLIMNVFEIGVGIWNLLSSFFVCFVLLLFCQVFSCSVQLLS